MPFFLISTTPVASAARTASPLPRWTGSSRGVARTSRWARAPRVAGGTSGLLSSATTGRRRLPSWAGSFGRAALAPLSGSVARG
eukprot:1055321-Alexandrium_andersonii.AAC.1